MCHKDTSPRNANNNNAGNPGCFCLPICRERIYITTSKNSPWPINEKESLWKFVVKLPSVSSSSFLLTPFTNLGLLTLLSFTNPFFAEGKKKDKCEYLRTGKNYVGKEKGKQRKRLTTAHIKKKFVSTLPTFN